jgi:hypothetical protein
VKFPGSPVKPTVSVLDGRRLHEPSVERKTKQNTQAVRQLLLKSETAGPQRIVPSIPKTLTRLRESRLVRVSGLKRV